MEEAREVQIQGLAKKFLEIPKEIRLRGEDGKIHIPEVPDKFYLAEVASWLSYAPAFAEENYKKRSSDYVLESKGYVPIRTINFDIDQHEPGAYAIPEQEEITGLQLFEPLLTEQLYNIELDTKDILRCSYSHHRFLSTALRKVHDNHNAFLEMLAEKLALQLRADQHYFSDALKILRKVSDELLELEDKGFYNIIPMLFSLRDHGVIMSTDLSNVFKYEVEEWGLLYSYGFSGETSHAVLVILKNFVANQIKRFETLIAKSSIEIPEVVDDKRMIFLPRGTKEKVKVIQEILGLNEDENENQEELALSPFQIMLICRAFQEKKFFRQNIDKYQLALAYGILTGGSVEYFYKQYRTDEMTASNLKTWSKKHQLKKVIESITQLNEKLRTEIIPFLSKLENLD